MAKRVALIQATVDPLLADEGAKKQRRDIEKKMTVHVQQISATLDQVGALDLGPLFTDSCSTDQQPTAFDQKEDGAPNAQQISARLN